MAIVLRAKTDPTALSNTSFSITKPAGTTAGDLLLMVITASNESANLIMPPAGWHEIRYGSLNGDNSIATFFKVAGGSEPASYTCTANQVVSVGIGILCLYSDTASPIRVQEATWRYNSSGDRIWQGLTLPSAGVVVCCGTVGNNFGTTPPGTFNEQWDLLISGNRAYCMTDSYAAGSTGNITATGTSASSKLVTVALIEAATTYVCPNLRSWTTTTPASVSGSFTAAIPSDVEAGDMLLLQVVTAVDRTISTPQGWTLLQSVPGTGGMRVYWRTADDSDAGSNVTIAFAGAAATMSAAVAAFVSRSGAILVIGNSTTGTNSSAADIDFPAVSADRDNAILVCLASNAATTRIQCEDISPFWERYDFGATSCSAVMCTELLEVSGDAGARVANWTSGSQASFVVSLTIEEVSEGVVFNSKDMRPYLRSWSLESRVRIADTTVLDSEAGEQIPIISDWVFSCTGLWESALDDIFGAQVVQLQEANNIFFLEIDNAIAYVSPRSFVTRYKVDATIDDVLVFEAGVTISGAPTRITL